MNKLKCSVSLNNKKLHHKGKDYKYYKFMGSRLIKINDKKGVMFSTWAPNALEVRVVGNFNNWNGKNHIMKKRRDGIWTLFVPNIVEGDIYKYEIITKEKKAIFKADPYAFYSELRPNTASIVVDLNKYQWKDKKWISNRCENSPYNLPMNIYEVSLGSWIRNEDNNFLSYRELADKLIDYVTYMGYTHIEILPLTEYPLDDSWGYQVTGYFSLTSRFGKPEEFMYLVDKCHENNIGVILDWVPGHFCKDDHGLYKFDGTHLYESSNPLLGENYDWGTANFDFTKNEVQNFLISNAIFWFKMYHIDGLRVDAVANMLYLDYGKRDMKIKNRNGGNENLEAVDFLKKLNEKVFQSFPNVLMIAEESTTWPGVTAPTYMGGLGFNYKWNMGWMNDMLEYMSKDPVYRKYHHNLITFSLMYAFSENFILPLSHDEVVHGKKSLLNKMPGEYNNKFANLRAFYGYMIGHPGKKLLFMGGEFGQFIEWNHNSQLDWNLLDYPMHKNMQSYTKALNEFYKNERALWERDHKSHGFQWIDHQNSNQSIISFLRQSDCEDDFLIVICNFTPEQYDEYRVGVPKLVCYKEVFNSDKEKFGGTNKTNKGIIIPEVKEWNGRAYSINIKIPPLSVMYLKPVYKLKISKKK